jgi:hypothetical protein
MIAISGPIGLAPWDTNGLTSTPRSTAPTAPPAAGSRPSSSAAGPGPPLAMPPITGTPGLRSESSVNSGSSGKL